MVDSVDTSGNEVPPRFETVSLPDESLDTKEKKKKKREKGEQMGEFVNAKTTRSEIVKYKTKDV